MTDNQSPHDTKWLDNALAQVTAVLRITKDGFNLAETRGKSKAKSAILAHIQQEKLALLEQLKADGRGDMEPDDHSDAYAHGWNDANHFNRQTIDTAIQRIKEGA